MSVMLNHRITGEGKPLILLHGLFGSLENLGGIARRLQDEWQIHALDERNHGASPHTDTMDYPAMAGDVLAYMDQQGLARAALLGHSMGGKVAMQVALMAPERVERLIVADIAPVTYQPRHDAILEGLKALDLSQVHSRQDADRLLAEFVDSVATRQFLLKNLERMPRDEQTEGGPTFRWRLNLPVIDACYGNLAKAPEGDGPYDGPVLFLKGADSAYIQDKHRDTILRLFPAAEVRVIQGTGHWLHAEKADTFAALCRRFLRSD
ncbi:alpha/beta fold hydrolase [Marinobacter lutaoensis]|uniref:Alpha/beta hydrolase n=1 Tax=Marinobacter lutaoensis TaxID=135739 RepID=A0A1V2DVI7_9GAMM|nr:alpha/beta fold hydrolase [Marinobacter lutaoensis]MBE03198.1 alpha/beta hydrolase [Marinobacter sp.]MBI44091.1 alpha/beta hydrolase [Oceanospirillales bacterium]NVD36970.1 alpha/beta fold hydrolase [Marinobacter lutaoensis]ONF44765.1 alpha/beta hydrolase [Marinobacter lutaoensis]